MYLPYFRKTYKRIFFAKETKLAHPDVLCEGAEEIAPVDFLFQSVWDRLVKLAKGEEKMEVKFALPGQLPDEKEIRRQEEKLERERAEKAKKEAEEKKKKEAEDKKKEDAKNEAEDKKRKEEEKMKLQAEQKNKTDNEGKKLDSEAKKEKLKAR